MRVGELIKTWRFVEKLDDATVADRIGISATTLRRIEKGIVPDGTTLLKVMAWLFGEEANGGILLDRVRSAGHVEDVQPLESRGVRGV